MQGTCVGVYACGYKCGVHMHVGYMCGGASVWMHMHVGCMYVGLI